VIALPVSLPAFTSSSRTNADADVKPTASGGNPAAAGGATRERASSQAAFARRSEAEILQRPLLLSPHELFFSGHAKVSWLQ
jgi:hypothetical protein